MIEVKSKDGKVVRCELNEFDYNGTFMGECFLSFKVSSPTPIEFTIGDYLDYRGERFVLNYTPEKQKKSSAGSSGEAFVYDNLKFNSLADELTRCRFLDYVPRDNKIHFSSLPIFSFYVSSARDLAERIQVNLDRVYTGAEKWTVTVDKDSISKDKNISVSNINCFDALFLANSELNVNFIIRGRTIKIGTSGLAVGKVFGYGKGNGLYDIEQTTNADSLIITRLRAYGSQRNLPYRYYNKLKNTAGNPLIPESQYVTNLMLPSFAINGGDAYIDSPNTSKYGVREGCVYFDGNDTNLPEIYPSMSGMTADDLRAAGISISLDAGDNGKLDEVVSAEQITDDGILPEDGDEESQKLKPTFKITIKDIGFDINDNLTSEKAIISINSGMCIGREFEIVKCVKIGNKYELVCNRFSDDSIGIAYPNSNYQIKPGDSFVLLQIEMPSVYVKAAEQRLLVAAKEYLPNNDDSKYVYTPKIDEVFMANHPDLHKTLKEGDILNFEDTDLGIDAGVIIQSLVIHEGKSNIPTYDVTLNNDRILSSIEKIQNAVNGMMSNNATGITIDQVKSLILAIGDKLFIRKDKPDWTDYLLGLNGGVTIGQFIAGLLGSGAIITKEGFIEARGMKLWEFLEVPELRFNRVDVVSGELWNAIAFGLIESVDETNKIVKLKLEEGELSGMHLNDFCRGIFHNLLDNETSPGVDSSGFDVVVGFRTGYFTPVEIIDNATFRYELKPGSTVHPCKAMKFAVYGNATDTNRQSSAYHTRTYTRYLSGVNTWQIDSSNIAVQLGDCSGLIIDGEPLAEASIYLNNVYFGGNVWFTPEFKEEIKGNDAYSVTLSTYNAVFNVADGIYEQADVVSADKNITTGANQVVASQFNVSTRIQASKGTEQLRYSTTIGAGKYLVTSTGSGCKYVITDGLIAVQEVFDDKAEIKVEVNCEGMATYEVVFTIVRVADGRDGKDYEYICTRTATEIKPAIPDTSQVDDYVPDGWTDDSVGPTLALPYEWISKRTKRDGVWGNYSSPSLFSRYGEDGTDIEYIYTRTIANTAPAKPKTSQNNDYIPDGWTDDPAGPTRELPHEWISSRKKDKEVWSEFSAPALWCRFAEDGKDHEFIYSRTTTNSRPGTPGTSQADDHVPYGWTDDAIGVNSTYVYEWRSERTKAKGVWGNFSAPALFARYSFDGNNGNNGTDGRTIIMIYRRSESQPYTPSGSTIPPSGWSQDPPAGSSPLWMSKATFYSNGVMYSNWSMPTRITGDTGASGIGTPGPAITNRNIYDGSKVYVGSTTRVDVVRYYFQGSYKYYMANTDAGVFSGVVPTNTSKWHSAGDQFESFATGLAIIGEASIASWRFREGYIESQNGNMVLNGNADARPKIALGASYANMDTAPTRMYDDGRIVTKNLTAEDGCKIGAFNIKGGRLTSSEGAYMDLNYDLTHIKMGPNLIPAVGGGYTGVMSVKNGINNYGDYDFGRFNSNTALELIAQGSDLNYLIKGLYFDSSELSLLFRRMPGDASWVYRGCIKVQRMPFKNHIDAMGAGNQYPVYWDDKQGIFFAKS